MMSADARGARHRRLGALRSRRRAHGAPIDAAVRSGLVSAEAEGRCRPRHDCNKIFKRCIIAEIIPFNLLKAVY